MQKKTILTTLAIATSSMMGCQHHIPKQAEQAALSHVYYDADTTVQLQIEPKRVACHSYVPMQCLEAIDNAKQETLLIWYNNIEGFKHTAGMRYVIDVRPQGSASSSDPSAQQWTLEQIISQTPAL